MVKKEPQCDATAGCWLCACVRRALSRSLFLSFIVCLSAYTNVWQRTSVAGWSERSKGKRRQLAQADPTNIEYVCIHESDRQLVGEGNRASWAFFRKRFEAWLHQWRCWRCLVFTTFFPFNSIESIFVVVVIFTFRAIFLCSARWLVIFIYFFFTLPFHSGVLRIRQCNRTSCCFASVFVSSLRFVFLSSILLVFVRSSSEIV